jgi:hypothetical protein
VRPPSTWAVRLLWVAVLLYIPVQWLIGRHPGSTSIFTPRHKEIRKEIFATVAATREHLFSQCAHHGIRDIYPTEDWIGPYLINQFDQAYPGCNFHRAVAISEPVEHEMVCSAVVLEEIYPNPWTEFKSRNLGLLEGKVTAVDSWRSETQDFGFNLLQSNECAKARGSGGE